MPKSGSGSPPRRSEYHGHTYHHSHYKKTRSNEFESDEQEADNYRYNDLRDRLNELRRSKDGKERTSSADRSKHYHEDRNFHRSKTESSTISTSSYSKSSQNKSVSKTVKDETYQKEHKKLESQTKISKIITDAEVSEIISEEELSSEEFESEKKENIEENKSLENSQHSDHKTGSSKRSISSNESISPKRSRTVSQETNNDENETVKEEQNSSQTPDYKEINEDSIDSENEAERQEQKREEKTDSSRSSSKEKEKPKIESKLETVEKYEENISIEEMEQELIQNIPEPIMYYCATQGCRSVEEFECLNKIEEGAYGVVYRAKDKKTNEQVALKRLKMEKEKDGFPITSLREVDTLLKCQHPNIVTVREIVVGSNMDKIYMVMDFVEHDLKSLMQYGMKNSFLMSEVKCLMLQLLSGIAHLHDNWIIHRDLKTSNLLLSHKGILKIADFGLAREYGSPLKEYTPVVVTLWYRSPELLLNTKKYSTAIDMWSVGCIFGELMLMKALFPGKNEKDQLDKIFKDLGTPTDKIWPDFKELPLAKKLNFPEFPYNTLRSRFGKYLSDKGFELINKLLTYDPNRRISAEEALKHDFFKESPLPIDPSLFPTWPAKSEGLTRKQLPQDSEPRAPSPGKMYEKLLEDEGFVLQPAISTGFQLRI